MNSFRFGFSLVLALAGAVEAQEPSPGQGAVHQDEVALGAGSKDAAAAAVPEDAAAGGVPEDAAAGAAPVDVAGAAASPAPPAAAPAMEETDGGAAGRPLVQTLGEADQKIFLVDHDGTWSMHFENVITGNVVLLWRQAGGPEVTMKLPVDRPFTMSVHQLAPELIVERLFEGYGYTMHYDDAGRLASVRVYSPRDGFAYKTPRLTQSLSDWKKAETEPEAAAGPPRQP